MTLKRAFIAYMETLGLGTFGTDIFLNGAPLNISPCWWVIATGGAPLSANQTGEKRKSYVLNVYYRNLDAETVDQTLQDFEERVSGNNCDQLEGFDTIDISTIAFPADQDIEVDDRSVGLVQVTVTTYL